MGQELARRITIARRGRDEVNPDKHEWVIIQDSRLVRRSNSEWPNLLAPKIADPRLVERHRQADKIAGVRASRPLDYAVIGKPSGRHSALTLYWVDGLVPVLRVQKPTLTRTHPVAIGHWTVDGPRLLWLSRMLAVSDTVHFSIIHGPRPRV
ncbi:hypothetical protein BJX63DRAFT_104801 [Aspergillus granulosus]|uniref:Uncharacterized protein n=1 Tax=Aspergillus granulosus TaxID=176169 RepID=A0ABR4GVY0_9EURO